MRASNREPDDGPSSTGQSSLRHPPAGHPAGGPAAGAHLSDARTIDPHADPLYSIGETLHRVTRLLQRYRVEALSKRIADADPSTARLIGALIRRGPMRMTALADATNADISTISRQVAALERRGLVERQVDPADRRTSLLIPTAAAVSFDQEYVRDRSARLEEVLSDWSEPDRRLLAGLLLRFSDDLQAHATGPATGDILGSRTEQTQKGMTS